MEEYNNELLKYNLPFSEHRVFSDDWNKLSLIYLKYQKTQRQELRNIGSW